MTGPIGFYRVVGESMLPTYRSGDLLLGWRWFKPKVGEVVVAWHQDRMYIKRIATINPDGVMLLGDNRDLSVDSRSFGLVQANQLKAKIIFKFLSQ